MICNLSTLEKAPLLAQIPLDPEVARNLNVHPGFDSGRNSTLITPMNFPAQFPTRPARHGSHDRNLRFAASRSACLAIAALFTSGCATTTDPAGDYGRFAQMVNESVGSAPYTPGEGD